MLPNLPPSLSLKRVVCHCTLISDFSQLVVVTIACLASDIAIQYFLFSLLILHGPVYFYPIRVALERNFWTSGYKKSCLLCRTREKNCIFSWSVLLRG
jgi:hypothetical protein